MCMKIALTSLSFLLLLAATFVSAQSNVSYMVTLGYDGTTLTNQGVHLIEGTAPTRLNQPDQGFILRVLSFDGQILNSFKFSIETMPLAVPPKEIFSENGTQIATPEPTITKTVATSVVLVVPYFSNAKSINIYDSRDALLLSIDVSQYSEEPQNSFFIWAIAIVLIVALLICAIFILRTRQKPNAPIQERIPEHHSERVEAKK